MKKLFLVLLLGLFIVTPVLADRNVATTKGFSSSQLVKRGDWKIYRISWYASAGNGNFAIYDSLNEGITNTSIKTEGSEATSGNGKPYDFTNKPLEGSTGLYLIVNNAQVVIEYE